MEAKELALNATHAEKEAQLTHSLNSTQQEASALSATLKGKVEILESQSEAREKEIRVSQSELESLRVQLKEMKMKEKESTALLKEKEQEVVALSKPHCNPNLKPNSKPNNSLYSRKASALEEELETNPR